MRKKPPVDHKPPEVPQPDLQAQSSMPPGRVPHDQPLPTYAPDKVVSYPHNPDNLVFGHGQAEAPPLIAAQIEAEIALRRKRIAALQADYAETALTRELVWREAGAKIAELDEKLRRRGYDILTEKAALEAEQKLLVLANKG